MTEEEHMRPPPCRLAQSSAEMARLFQAAESTYRQGLDEAAAWQALSTRLERPATRARARVLRLSVAIAAVAAGVLLGWFGLPKLQSASTAIAVQARSTAPALPSPSVTSLHLAPGRSQLADGTEVDLSDGSEGTFVSDEQRSTLALAHGHVNVVAAHQARGRHFAVHAQGFEFRVIGTRFSVTATGTRVDLAVSEGRVGVYGPNRTPQVVDAGGHWSSLDEANPGEANPDDAPTTRPRGTSLATTSKSELSSPDTPASNNLSDCKQRLTSGDAPEAERCYLEIAKGNGLSAEMALYEVARLRSDVLSNQAGSLAALDDYISRFSAGTFAQEVRMARINLLSRMGRVDEALKTSEAALANPSSASHRVELHLLRGNLLRDGQQDCARALLEYRQIQTEPGARGDQAQFAAANCLERLGRNAEAVATYQRYLERPSPRQAERARQRLKELQP